MGLWIGWDGRSKYIYYATTVVMMALCLIKGIKFDFDKRKTVPLFFLLFAFSCFGDMGFGAGTFLGYLIPISIIVLLNENDQVRCLHYIVKWFAILMVPCIITYIIVQTTHISSFGQLIIRSQDYITEPSYLYRKNYLFYCYTDYMGIRFNGPFIEPGHVGMMSAFLLFADGFQLRQKETWILLIAITLTLSLAGFAFAAIAYLFNAIHNGSKKAARYLTLFFIVAIPLYLFATYYNGGQNILNEMIVSRLAYDEEKGFVGNNRIFGQLDLYYLAMFTDSHLLLYGYDADEVEFLLEKGAGGIGFAMWMVQHGLLGTIGAYMFYLIFTLYSKNKKYALLAFFFFVLLFWQRSYPFWMSWVVCYVYGITNNRLIEKKVIKQKKKNENWYLNIS